MHGIVHDWVVLNTCKLAAELASGEGVGTIRDQLGNQNEIDYQPRFARVLEIGSLDINGSMKTYNFLGKGTKWFDLVSKFPHYYLGIDIKEGRGVDEIMNAHKMRFDNETFDLVLCLSMLEHDNDPQATIKEAYRVLEPNGLLLLTTVSKDHEEHPQLGGGNTETYNKFSTKQVLAMCAEAGFKDIDHQDPRTEILVKAVKP